MKRFAIIIALAIGAFSAYGNDVFAPVLQQIEQNSTTLQALREQMEADKLAHQAGLAPYDPEVEFGYLWGGPAAIGNRKDISVSQSFDFPTAYIQRSKLADLKDSSTEYRYRTERMQLLLAAKELCIELIYNNKMREMYAVQHRNAGKILAAYETLMQSGEANRLEYNKASMNYATMDSELKRIDLERERLLTELAAMNGGQPVSFDATAYTVPTLPTDFEQWYAEAEAINPSLQYLRSQVEVAGRQVKVSQAEMLPQMAVGYMGEFVAGERFQGITVGLSVPLWHDKHRVRQARAQALATASMAEDSRVQYYNHLRSLYQQVTALQQSTALYASALADNGNGALLLAAYEKGQLTLLDYLIEMDYYYTCMQRQAEAEKELAHAWAQLTAYQL